jgi:serine/threonine protein phosphatase 1
MSAVLAPIKSAERIWVVGAINGDYSALCAVHRKLAERIAPGDRLIYLGNYWGDGTGQDVIATINELLLFRRFFIAKDGVDIADIAFLRGAAEEMLSKLQQIQFAPNPGEVFDWMLTRGIAGTIRAYGFDPAHVQSIMRQGAHAIAQWTSQFSDSLRRHPGHGALMSDLKHAAYSNDGLLIFVHAGLDGSRPLTGQTDTFWWGGSMFEAITERYYDCARIIRGASITQTGLQEREFTVSVDGGAGRGGVLIALALDGQGKIGEQITSDA